MRIKSSIKNISSGMILQVVTMVTGFVTRTLFINILGNTYLGVSGLFSNILSLLSLAELGIGQAITFSLYKPIAEDDEDKICRIMNFYKQVYRVIFVFVLVAGLVLTPFLPYIIKNFEDIPNLSLIYVMYVINSAVSYLFIYKSTLVIASQRDYVVNKITYIFSVIMTVVQIIVLIIFRNYLVYLSSQIIMVIIQNIVIAREADKMFPSLKTNKKAKLEADEKKGITKNIRALMIYKVGTLALNSTDNILISAFVGVIKLGLYSNYTLITSSISKILSTVFNSLTASIGNLNTVETREKKADMFNIINLSTFWLYGVCSICIFCVANPFIEAWIGREYWLSMRELFVIVLNMYIGGMLFTPLNYRQTMGLFVYGKLRPIISAVINLVASVILGKRLGLEGILWGTIIARVTTNVWFDPYIIFKKGLEMSPKGYFYDYILKFAIYMVTLGGCYGLVMLIPDFTLSFIVKAVVTFAVSNLVFFIIYGKSKEVKYLYDVIKRMITQRGKV